MIVLGKQNEVFVLMHSVMRSYLGLPTSSYVERIDPTSLATIARSPSLSGGPCWPGSVAIHRNGCIYVVYGAYAHKLNRECDLLRSYRLDINQPHNG